MDIVILIYLAFRISIRARLKGQNVALWILVTVLAFFMGEVIGLGLIMAMFYRGPMDPQTMVTFMYQQPIRAVFAFLCGFGGYLLIRYILDRMPNKNIGDNNTDGGYGTNNDGS